MKKSVKASPQKPATKMTPLSAKAQKQMVGGAKAKTTKGTCDAVGGKWDARTSMCTY